MFSGHDPLRVEAVAGGSSGRAEECHPRWNGARSCALGTQTTADLWSVRANTRRNSHCAPTVGNSQARRGRPVGILVVVEFDSQGPDPSLNFSSRVYSLQDRFSKQRPLSWCLDGRRGSFTHLCKSRHRFFFQADHFVFERFDGWSRTRAPGDAAAGN